MVKGVNDFSLMGSARLVFLFSFVSIFFMKSVSALVYLGQSYSGWGIGGYGWNDIASLYATSGGWFDFAILFALFYSLALGVFGEKFKDNNAGKGLAVALGLLLSLSLVLYESYMGMSLWELAAPFIVLGALLGTFALVHWTFKAMDFGGLTRVLASTIAIWLVWLGITSSIGMGQGTFFGFTMGGFDLREPMAWILIPIFLVLIWNLFKSFGGDPGREGTGERRRGWFNWLKPLAKNYWKRAGENATKSVERKIARSTKGRPDLMHKQIDPDKLKLLNHYIAKIQDQKNKVFFLNNQLIVDIYTLNENLNKRESSLNLNAWGIGNKLNERVKDISNLKQMLVSQNTSLEGLAGLVNYFKIILTELNKVLAITKQINLNPYETYRRKINKSNGEVWSSLNDLKTLINQLFSISREHIGKSVDKLTLAEFMEIIGSWISSSNEDINDEKMPNPVKETERKEGSSEEELHGPDTKGFAKSIRNEILLRTHPDKTTNPQLRAIFNLTNQAYAEGDYNRLNDLRAQMYRIIGNQQKRLPDSRSSDIEELESIISSSTPIAIPPAKRSIFVKKKKQRVLNVAQFASYVLFSDASKKSSDAYKLREQLTSIIPTAYVQLEEWANLLNKSHYYTKNGKNYREFMEQYTYLLKFKPKVDKLKNGIKAEQLKKLASKAFSNLSQDQEFNHDYFEMFRQKTTTGNWEVIMADPDRLNFILDYSKKDEGQVILRNYFNIAYDALISLDAMMNKLKRTVAIVKKDWKNP